MFHKGMSGFQLTGVTARKFHEFNSLCRTSHNVTVQLLFQIYKRLQ